MSAVTLLKHVFTFRKILNDAASDNVRSWDGAAIGHALQWAEYCEKVSLESNGKPVESFLSDQLKRMVLLENPPSGMPMTFDDLGRARSILLKTLLVNPRCSSAVVQYIWTETSVDDKVKFAQTEGNLRLSEEIIHFLSERQSTSKIACPRENFVDVQCDFMRELIDTLSESCRKPEEMTAYIQSIARIMSSQSQSLGILVGCISSLSHEKGTADSGHEETSRLMTAQVLLDWLEEFVTQNYGSLLVLHPHQLVRVAWSCPRFCDIYIVALDSAARLLQTETVKFDMPQMNAAPSLWPWRSRPEFGTLVQHFQALCGCSESAVSQRIKNLLRDKCATEPTTFSVWSDISRRISGAS